MSRRVAVIGGGISGLGAAWGLHQHPDRFDFRLFEARDRSGGNAITVDMPQDDGGSIPFDISATARIPSVYHHVMLRHPPARPALQESEGLTASGTGW